MPVMCSNLPRWLNTPINAVVSVVDHTYVTSSQNHRWGCHGRDNGGNLISSGSANPQEANCIYGNDLAGIKYLITGVCHQIANRTLSPAGLTVHQAKGYFASVATYGKYGYYKAEWASRKKQCFINSHYQNTHNRLYQSLIMQRLAFENRSLTEEELLVIYPNISNRYFSILEEKTRYWKIQFLSHAIEYHESNDFLLFQRLLHQNLNLFIKSVGEIVGAENIARLLNIEVYDDNTFICFSSFTDD